MKRFYWAAVAAVAVAACTEGPSGPAPGAHYVVAVSGGGVTDTALAYLAEPLVIEVRESDGRPVAGARVHLVAGRTGPEWESSPSLSVAPDLTSGFDENVVTVTDAEGRVSVRVRLGTYAGDAGVVVRELDSSASIMVRFSVLPGNPVRLRLAPADTMAYPGGRITPEGRLIDAHGNQTAVELSFEGAGGPVRVEDGQVSALTYGRGWYVGRHGSLRDTARISVIPRGRIAAVSVDGDGTLLSVELDGSAMDTIARGGRPSMPAWYPDGQTIIYHANPSSYEYQRLFTATAGTLEPVRVMQPDARTTEEAWPSSSADGQWLYYTAGMSNQVYAIWRVRPDGAGAEIVTAAADSLLEGYAPAISSDGRKLLFTRHMTRDYYDGELRVLDVESGSITVAVGWGRLGRWSPAGTASPTCGSAGPTLPTPTEQLSGRSPTSEPMRARLRGLPMANGSSSAAKPGSS